MRLHFVARTLYFRLLDGLDEVASARQRLCVERINQFLHPSVWSISLVVCSRTEEFQRLATPLELNGAIILQPLSLQQIQDYVLRTEGEVLWNSIKDDQNLMKLAKTPLFLNILVISWKEISFSQWQLFESREKRLSYLFEAYIRKMFSRPYQEEKPSQEKTRYWLKWLAIQLNKENTTEFFIENLQPCWLNSKNRGLNYKLIYGLIDGFIGGLVIGLMYGLTGWLLPESNLGESKVNGLILGLILGFFIYFPGGLIGGLESSKIHPFFKEIVRMKNSIQTADRLKISFSIPKNKLISEIKIGLILALFGIPFAVTLGLLLNLITINISSMILVLLIGLIAGLSYGLIRCMVSPESVRTKKVSPNQGIKESLRNARLLSILIYPVSLLISLLLCLLDTCNLSCFKLLIVALFPALAYGISSSGMPAIQHFSLRIVLCLNGYIPWNYARFLDYATNRLFLQRVGGGYRFIHRLLQEHFAQFGQPEIS